MGSCMASRSRKRGGRTANFCTVTDALAIDFRRSNTLWANGTSWKAEFLPSLGRNLDKSQQANCRETTSKLQNVYREKEGVDPRNSGCKG